MMPMGNHTAGMCLLAPRDIPSGDAGLFAIYPNSLTRQTWNADAQRVCGGLAYAVTP